MPWTRLPTAASACARGHRAGWLLAAVMAAATLLCATPAWAVDRAATTSTFASVWSASQGGDRILLASGSYGTFTGGTKTGTVTITPQPGATATMSRTSTVRAESASTASRSRASRSSARRATSRSRTRASPGMAVVRAEQMSNANIVFDGNTHANINVCGDCYEGRLQVAGSGPQPVRHDDPELHVRAGRRRRRHADRRQRRAGPQQRVHRDQADQRRAHRLAAALRRSATRSIRGNYFHDFDVAIMAPDGGSNEQITDNVFIGAAATARRSSSAATTARVFAHNVDQEHRRATWTRRPATRPAATASCATT